MVKRKKYITSFQGASESWDILSSQGQMFEREGSQVSTEGSHQEMHPTERVWKRPAYPTPGNWQNISTTTQQDMMQSLEIMQT